jgi:hypothetical protein
MLYAAPEKKRTKSIMKKEGALKSNKTVVLKEENSILEESKVSGDQSFVSMDGSFSEKKKDMKKQLKKAASSGDSALKSQGTMSSKVLKAHTMKKQET